MPIYEYSCQSCGHGLEAIQKVSDQPLTTCPACGQPRLKKLISAAGFQLKGSGWYATDFKKGGKPAAATESTSSESSGESKPAGGCGGGACGCAGG